ncbi:MAG: hypothetical protein KAR38_11200 [Calditrichia bacterium]|nr:hypothetical protein [Calditrichia bacterium]
MKQKFFITLLLTFVITACNKVQEKTGVIFSEAGLENVVVEAGKSGKKVFLDFYADW